MSPSLIVSILAVVISGIAVYISRRTQNRLVDIEDAREKDRLTEKQKANLTARISREPLTRGTRSATQYFLYIENSGSSEARDIKINLDGKPLLAHSSILENTEEVTQVGPNSYFRYLLVLSSKGRSPSNIEVTWEDDSGEPGKYSTTLTL